MNWELVILAKLVRATDSDGIPRNRDAEYRQLSNLGITDDLFSFTTRPVWKWLREVRTNTDSLPTANMMAARWPGVKFPPTYEFECAVAEDSLEEVVTRLRERKIATITLELVANLERLAEDDPGQVPDLVNQFQRSLLGSLPLPALIKVGDVEGDMLEYQKIRDGDGGLVFPFEHLVPGGLGLNPAAAYAIYGPPGSKKTWLLFWMALWYVERGFRVLLLNQEMPWKRSKWRMYTLRGRYSWNDVTSAAVPDTDMASTIAYFDVVQNLFSYNPIHSDDARPIVQSIIEKVQPDVIFDDSPYLRSVEGVMIRESAKAGSAWMGFMKGMATKYEVPYFFTWQPNDEGQMYGGRAGFHDCELIMHIDGPRNGDYTEVELKKNREGTPSPKFKIFSDLTATATYGQPYFDDAGSAARSVVHGGKKPKIKLRRRAEPEVPEEAPEPAKA